MQLTGLDLIFWVASLAGHVVLLSVLLIRQRAAHFPVFTTLITVNIVKSIVLYFTHVYGSKHTYFTTYWSLAVVDAILQLLIVLELASHVFRPLGSWAHDVRRGFVVLFLVSVTIASGLTWLATPATQTLRQTVVIRGNFFSSTLMSELFVGMIILSVTAGLPWKTHVARISQGLGVYSIFGIMTEAAHSYFGVANGLQTYALLSHIRIAAYLLCLLYWIVMLWRNAPVAREVPERMHQQLLVLQRRVSYGLRDLRTRRND